MKKENKDKKKKKSPPGRKNLSVANHGDIVVIRNRSTIAAGVFGAIVLFLCIAAAISFKDAWSLPLFWVLFGVFVAAALYSMVNMIFGKIVLNSPEKQMIVCNPTKKEYSFDDINYVDMNTVKASNGERAYKVTVYIGIGKKTVELISFSEEQATELCHLLRGMLDHGAMEYPEGNEEPFHLDDEEEKRFEFIKRRKKTDVLPSVDEGNEASDDTDKDSEDDKTEDEI